MKAAIFPSASLGLGSDMWPGLAMSTEDVEDLLGNGFLKKVLMEQKPSFFFLPGGKIGFTRKCRSGRRSGRSSESHPEPPGLGQLPQGPTGYFLEKK